MGGIVSDVQTWDVGVAARANQLPKCRIARRVRDQVDALVGRWIHNVVQAPVIEHPGLACGHMDTFSITIKPHFLARDHRYVDTYPGKPVIVGVGMPNMTAFELR